MVAVGLHWVRNHWKQLRRQYQQRMNARFSGVSRRFDVHANTMQPVGAVVSSLLKATSQRHLEVGYEADLRLIRTCSCVRVCMVLCKDRWTGTALGAPLWLTCRCAWASSCLATWQ